MIKIDTLHAPTFLHAPAITKATLAEFSNLTTVEIWKSKAHNSFEYRLFHARRSSPCIRIRHSGVN